MRKSQWGHNQSHRKFIIEKPVAMIYLQGFCTVIRTAILTSI